MKDKDKLAGRVIRVVLRELGSGRRMEVVGVYAECRGNKVEEEGVRHSVTPLWCAAVSGRLGVVRVLLR